VKVELNGKRFELPDGATIRDAVGAAGADADSRGVAVAVDGEVVPRSRWEQFSLAEGQALEIVVAVQGG